MQTAEKLTTHPLDARTRAAWQMDPNKAECAWTF